ncbi:ATP-dependent helicase/nuclease subunit A [mine drainage metagenome]|uniref:DNA 3'-5' helicase n=1 Tax=mine drainage metagenome TaxID=410659 RepID=A0A1J5TCB5_9ZZZZ
MTDLMTPDLNAQDSANRERALAHASFIVEAPAGAGKTELLTQRYLSLLASVAEPEEIIALTFTNKAAAEMRNRILLSLEHAQNQTSETAAHKLKTRALANAALSQSNQKQWDILNQPSRLRILTIDALCSSLTRQMPLLSRFGGQPQVSDDADTHYLEAARRAISHIMHESSPDDTVTTALRYMDNNSEKLTALLAKMLARRDQWLPLAGQLHVLEAEDIASNTEVALRHLIAETLQAALHILPARLQLELMPLARFAASNLTEEADIAVLLDWEIALTTDADDLVQWQALSSLLVTQSARSYRKTVTKNNGFPADKEHKDKKEAFLEIVASLDNSEVIAALGDLPSVLTLEEDQPIIQALTKLLMLAATHLWAIFQAAGEVDFVAIAQSAQQALENEQGVTDLALKLDYQISHLLIDEFQDTSPVQMRLIEKLIEGWQPDDGRTLFCVGDPMQSIYRFRKAEVSLFLQASQFGIGHLPLECLQLSRNNRSHPEVVSWINQAFQQVFPGHDNINQGAISYREFIATRSAIDGEGVVLHPLILAVNEEESAEDSSANSSPDNNLDTKRIEAQYVADLIVKLCADKPVKIAVLVRSRSHLKELVSEIRRNHSHLKFQALEIEPLNDRQVVQDALSLTRALFHRADRIHWLNILRAPWCGLTLADLHALAADNHRATIWQLMHDDARLQNLSADGLLRLAHVKTVLTAAFEGQGRMPIRRWLESTWLQLGGGKCLANAGDNRDVQEFFDLVEKTSRSGHVDIASLELGMQKLYAQPDIEADDSLQFLTIHKSKGLEFDTVILPALNRPPRHADNELVLWQEVMVDGHLHLIAAPFTPTKKANAATKSSAPSVYQFLKDLEGIRSDNEIVRLLYVAATRSQRQLHIIASMQPNKKGELRPAAKSLLKVLWPAVQADFEQATSMQPSQGGGSMDIRQFQPQLQRLDSSELGRVLDAVLSNANVDSNSVTLAPNQGIASLADYLKGADLQRHCGTLAHKYMEMLAATELVLWDAARLQQCKAAMQKWLMQQGHAAMPAQQGAAHVLAALQTTLSSDAGRWVLKPYADAASELSLMQTQEADAQSPVQNHVIDRTFVEDGVRWIVDYKLTQLDENIDFTEAAKQHRPQLERYAGLFVNAGLPIKMAVLFLSTGMLVEL